MNDYKFYQDRKITSWERTHFTIKANHFEEALAIISSWKGEDVLCFTNDENILFVTGELLYDTAEPMCVKDNNGEATIEVYSYTDELLFDNKTTNTHNI